MLQKTTQKLWSTAYKINHDDRRGRFGVCRTETDHRWLRPRFMQLPHTSSSSSRREKYEPRARTKWRPQTSDLIGRLDRGRGVGVARTLWCALLGISPTCKHSAPHCLLLIAEIPSLLSMVSFFSCYQCLLSYSKLILDIFEGWNLCVMVSTQFSYLYKYSIFFFSTASYYTAYPAYQGTRNKDLHWLWDTTGVSGRLAIFNMKCYYTPTCILNLWATLHSKSNTW